MFERKLSFTIGTTTQDGGRVYDYLIAAAVSDVFRSYAIDGFSINENIGYWKGNQERSLTASVLVEAADPALKDAEQIAKILSGLCDQECVLWCIEVVQGGLS